MTGPVAIVTGVTGQDGILMARALTRAGLSVVGTVRPRSRSAAHIADVYLRGVEVIEHDVRDADGFERLVRVRDPHVVVNLAGITSVGACEASPQLCQEVNETAVRDLLKVLVRLRDTGHVVPRFLQASSAQMYGDHGVRTVDEATPHSPVSAYGRAKSRAHQATVTARERDGLFACAAVLFNHESPLRTDSFVTGKITRAAAEIAAGQRDSLELGNVDVARDWGWASDYVEAMVAMLLAVKPRDYVVATGTAHRLGDLVERAFAYAGLDEPWSYVSSAPGLRRAVEPQSIVGDASRARHELRWTPRMGFSGLVARMVDVDVIRVRTGIEHSENYLSDQACLAPVQRGRL